MIDTRLKLGALAVACCFVLILVPMLASGQGVIQKGVQGVQKGVETGVEKTKEGAEATKNAITGEDQNTEQNRMKPQESTTETQPSEKGQRNMTSETEQKTTETGQKNMPRTAGELPLLALAGCAALSAYGLSRVTRRQKN